MHNLIIGTIVLSLISPVFYTRSMLAGKSKPHRVTRLVVWLASVAGMLGVVGGSNTPAQVFALIFLIRATYLLAMSVRFGVGGHTRLDITCLIVASIGIVGYALTGNGLLAVAFGIAADVIGYIPTFVKTYKVPESEDPTFFATEGLASLLAVFAVGSLEVGIIFPCYFVLCSALMVGLIYRPRSHVAKRPRQ